MARQARTIKTTTTQDAEVAADAANKTAEDAQATVEAEAINEGAAEVSQDSAEEPISLTGQKIEDLTVAEMKQLAEQEDIDLEGATRKADIAEKLQAADVPTLPLGAAVADRQVWSGPATPAPTGKPVATFGSYTGPLGPSK